jgi:uncharacterized membrane protein
MHRVLLSALLSLSVLFSTLVAAQDPSYTFTVIDFPGASFTQAWGINNAGDIVGYYLDATGRAHDFLLSGGRFTTIDVPGSFGGIGFGPGINNHGDIAGSFNGPCGSGICGYLLRGGSFTTIAFPGAIQTDPMDINDAGDIVGFYGDSTGPHGFLLRGGSFTTIDFPGGHSWNEADGINNAGDIVGLSADPGNPHHYLLRGGSFSTVDFPGFQNLLGKLDINNAGDIVGSYNAGDIIGSYFDLGEPRGYLLSGGRFTTIAVPGAPVTFAHGINDKGWIVGHFVVDPPNQYTTTHGFLAIPVSVPVPFACPLGQGFWKNHPNAWPVSSLTLGSQTYSRAELLNILNTPVREDASLILADQLIVTKLNIADGSDPTPVSATIADADRLLSGFAGKLPYNVRPSSTIGQAMVNDATVLESYNNGELTPNCTP